MASPEVHVPLPLAPLAALALAASPAPPPPDVPARLLGGALVDGQALTWLEELTDTVGARLAGSPGAAAAIDWARRALAAQGLRPWTEPVTVPVWVRGEERGELLATPPARPQPLAVAALGNSPGTPPGGLEAEVVEVRSLEELAALGERARGKLVLFQHDMGRGQGYGDAVGLRGRGPAAAARAGAAGVLIRSLSTASLRTPHTGMTRFPEGVTPIPAAAVSAEDSDLLHRRLAHGPVRVRLVLGCAPGRPPTVEQANVLAEVRGRERPEEVVVLAAHLDSWDLGPGAVDDGAGVVMAMEALRLVARQPVAPRRTVRLVLYLNEENGVSGGVAYAERHAGELGRHVAALEADSGAGRPLGLGVGAGPGGEEQVRALLAPLATIGAAGVREGDGGVDIGPLRYARVPVLGLWQEGARYFDWHHSAADTFDKVVPLDLALGAGVLAVAGWQLADAPGTLPRPPAPTEPPWWAPAPAAPAAAPAR